MDWTIGGINTKIDVYFTLIELDLWIALFMLWPRNYGVTTGMRCEPADGYQVEGYNVQLAGRLAVEI